MTESKKAGAGHPPEQADISKPEAGETPEARKPGRPKFRRRAEARKDEVLDAALELFIQNGYAATRVEDIATRAGISKGTVYLYFASKEALMEGLIDRALSPVASRAIVTIDTLGLDPRMALKTLGGLIARNLSDPKIFAVPKLIVRESVQFPELAQIYRRDVLDKVLPPMKRLIEHQVRLGRFKPVDADLAIRSIVGPVIGHMIMAEVFGLVPEGGLRMEQLLTQHIDIFLNGISVEPERKNG